MYFIRCDYVPTIPKIGPKKAYDLILKYRNIDEILKNEGKKYVIPENFNYQEARDILKIQI